MENVYGIQVQNKFNLFLNEDEDPLSVVERELASAAKPDKTKKEKAKKPDKKELIVPPGKPQAQKAKDAKDSMKEVEKENKPTQMRDSKDQGPRRGGSRGGTAGEYRGVQRTLRQDRPLNADRIEEKDGERQSRRGGYTNFADGAVPPRFAGGERDQNRGEHRGGLAGAQDQVHGDQDRFNDRFGESGFRGGGRGRGFRGGRGEFVGRGRGFRGGRGRGFGGGFASGGTEGGLDNVPHADQAIEVAGERGEGGDTGGEFRGGFGAAGGEDAEGDDRGVFGTFGEEEAERASGARAPRGGFRGRGRPRGFGRGEFRGGRGRQFERQSGSDKTGVKPVEKREGGGSYNWGTTQDEFEAETEPLNVTASDEATPDTDQAEKDTTGGAAPPPAAPEEQEPQEQQLTLEEWKALQEPRKKAQFNIRRPGEGVDDKEWKNLVPLKKAEKAPVAPEDEEDEMDEEEEGRHGKKQLVNIKINFISEERGGGRGGFSPRGRGGRGGFGAPRGQRGGFGGEGRGGRGGFGGENRGGGFGNEGGRGRGGGRRDAPYRMDEESFPELTPTVA